MIAFQIAACAALSGALVALAVATELKRLAVIRRARAAIENSPRALIPPAPARPVGLTPRRPAPLYAIRGGRS